ncbi:MAG: chromosomal replication initiator protein DnaA [Candidatus Dadabacteria bacterium]|nr:chromosomal replication initiator protein DnaA [Candidatus Dadabacteria bacterium]
MQRENLDQVWSMLLAHVRQGSNIPGDMLELLSRSRVSALDRDGGFVEITPGSEMDVNYLKSNLGNTLSEITEYFSKFHGVERVEIVNCDNGVAGKKLVLPPESENERREVYMGYLNSKYAFDNYIVGESNEFAFAAAMGAAVNPGKHNPLFITGASGLGKTHLMNAIGNEFARRNPGLNICSLSSEEFTNIVVDHLKGKNTSLLRQKLRKKCDLLMIDDIQFLEGKNSTINEFFHTFNTLYEDGKQIVLTSDKLPNDMDNFEERLKSRFLWGVSADIRPPDIETRAAIVKKKAEEMSIEIPEGVIKMVSEKVKNNVRELEGALLKLVIQAQVEGKPIDIRMAAILFNSNGSAIRTGTESKEPKITAELIKATVVDFFGVKKKDLVSMDKSKVVAFPRQIAMFLMKKHLEITLVDIGRQFNGRDHSTVLYSTEKIEKNLADREQATVAAIKEIEDRLNV